ncbi:Choline-sulfatase [Pigmentiphaga humi]|uniref:Choline-sulfatase n=1 Tax=Pigmentiphaga humi TaxID=2478468 RepID=A0A3P4AW50_9BURK|nr:sulfatase-like hydrolase/transferase [Pigmentiphaga humi]VCU68243.1 Choline-sulfatase [Pigmentiphaga humi]
MEPMNLLIIMDDEHNKKVLGYNGHPMVKTPNLDKLAARATSFEAAYSSSPICVPARAAFATGRPVYETGYWDNAIAYDGRVRSWAHELRDAGRRAVSIGKLHYTGDDIDGGFTEQIIPMHIEAGVGDLYGLVRDPLPIRHQSADLAKSIGPGESSYTRYDRDITDRTVAWLHEQGGRAQDRPWVLFSSFIAPHSPLIAPPEFYAMYDPAAIPLPKRAAGPLHPWIQAWNDCYRFDSHFESDAQRRIAIASYFGLCSFLDHNVGRILHALETSGLAGNTRVIFLSDHGDNLGSRSLWGKSTMYEESAGIPMLAAGPGLPAGKKVRTPVSHLDCYPTVMQTAGLETPAGLAGRSLFDIAREPDDAHRTILSEYHAAGSVSAAYMLRRGRHKYIHYTGYAPELFDLERDPEELDDLAGRPESRPLLDGFEAHLRTLCDPEAVDRQAKRDQAEMIARHGGTEAILKRGGSSYTPIPGEEVKLLNDD